MPRLPRQCQQGRTCYSRRACTCGFDWRPHLGLLMALPPCRAALHCSQGNHTSFMRLNYYPATPVKEEGFGLNHHTGLLVP